MIQEEFNYLYIEAIKQSNNFNDLKPIMHFTHEIMACFPEETDAHINYIKKIEEDLINRGVLSFKVEKYEDINRINPSTQEGFIQWCLWSLISRK